MTNKEQHINYTFADIERYLQDMMSPTERFQLEKAALGDPFLADAMEGYEATFLATAKEHLSAITNRLSTSINEDKEYTRADIENYLKGNMTAAQMHAIEKAALKDPFLADAMEGYEEIDFSGTKNNLKIAQDDVFENKPIEQLPTYNFNDIELYIENKMPSDERHLMEKTALKEPFLSDAIEGYEQANLSVAKQHLTNIETAILGEEKEATKVVSMNAASNKNNWLRIAAAVILMIGVGSTVWLSNKKEVPPSIAYVKEEEIKQVPSATPTTKLDATKTATASKDNTNSKQSPQAIATQPTVESASIATAEKKNIDKGVPASTVAAAPVASNSSATSKWADDALNTKRQDANNSIQKFTQDSIAVAATAMANVKKELAYNNAKNRALEATNKPVARNNAGYDAGFANKDSRAQVSNQLRGTVVNTNGQPVPFAKVNLNRNAQRFSTIKSDASGNFLYYSADTVLNAEVAANGYAQQNATINANTMNTIVLQKDESLAETIVTENIGRKKKQTNTAEATLGTPVGGLKSFEDYVSKKKEKLKKDSSDEEEYVEALVELEFDVDRLGKPYNISVTNANNVDTAISSKAIQIVKEGPAWIADKKKRKAKVTIKL